MAKDSLSDRQVSQAYLDKANTEQLIGMSNAIPLIAELLLGSFKPKLVREKS